MNDSLRPKTQLHKAVTLVIMAAFFNSLMILFAKLATQLVSVQIVMFFRFFVTLIIILPFIYFNREQKSICNYLQTKRFPLHLTRDIAGLISIGCYFYAAKNIPLADAAVLFNTSPLFIPIIAFFWGGFKIIHRLWWGLGLGFFGIIILLHPGHEIFNFAAIAGMLSGIFAAIAFIGGRYLTYTEPPLRSMFYYFFVTTILALGFLLITHTNISNAFQTKPMLLLIAVGVFGYLYQLCLTNGSKHAPVRLTSSFLYVGVIFSFGADWLIWNIKPTLISCLGILSIVAGSCLLIILYPKSHY